MTCGPRGYPGAPGVDKDGNPVNNIWLCDGIACDRARAGDRGAIHTTCKKAKEAEGYTFAYTERARLAQGVYEKGRDIRLANMPQPMAEGRSLSRVQQAIAAAQRRLQEDNYFKK